MVRLRNPNPKPQTLNPKPKTPNPKPQTVTRDVLQVRLHLQRGRERGDRRKAAEAGV